MKPHLKEYAYPAILEFIKEQTKGKKCVVIGLSGGIDSAVVSKLCCDALGPERVFNIIMPSSVSSKKDVDDAQNLCTEFGMNYKVIQLDTLINAFSAILDLHDPLLKGNIMARVRMTILYHHAHQMDGVVMGTGNKSELLTGYFTKHGDGGVDLLPIGDLYKTEVRELAEKIQIPQTIITKSPSAGLRAGQTDEEDLGVKYDELDQILLGLEQLMSVDEIQKETGLEISIINSVFDKYQSSTHKRKMPLIPKLGIRTIGCDWRE
ncbi:NAD+ synthase [Candidatus Methanomassiliicoccus intestinalis]|uniref:NAD+ synthase n=1 Tax=Candidatus Methanomassiliicoccus intestinalis TaxID=1406512 RepID=UPI0037DCA688